jgi:hypothetical protein
LNQSDIRDGLTRLELPGPAGLMIRMIMPPEALFRLQHNDPPSRVLSPRPEVGGRIVFASAFRKIRTWESVMFPSTQWPVNPMV